MKLKRLFVFLIIIIALGFLSVYYPHLTGKLILNSQNYEKEPCFVERVIDGDTLICDNQTIRLLGVNTPEKNKPYYEEAKNYLKKIENKSIFILRDYEDLDKYKRKLRYVFYENRLLNAEILEKGFGTSFMIEGLKHEKDLKSSEKTAEINEIGLWEKSKEVCSNCIELIELNRVDEYFILRNNCVFDCDLSDWTVKDDANHFFKLNNLLVGESEKYDSKTKIWNDGGDRFFMGDGKGELAAFYEY